MTNTKLSIKAALQLQKPIHKVFEAIVDPEKMSNYFISHGSGRMEEGKTLIWKFPEFEMEFPIRVGKIEKDKYISFFWDNEGIETFAEIFLSPTENNSTLVSISEKEMENNEAGIKWLQGNTEGWANFLACLKAYLEYGIQLRQGGYDFLMKKD